MARRHESLIPLSRQHHHALVLALLIRRRDGWERSEAAWLEETSTRVREAYSGELAGHFEVEETLLFPEMERHMGRLELVAELRQEHRALRRFVESSESAPNVALFDDFAALLDAHVHKEEQRLFAEFEKRMPGEEALKLGREIDARLTKACPRFAAG
jgi:Hemerythrin HHE cation binding domain